jgi:Glyoxalase-like domain
LSRRLVPHPVLFQVLSDVSSKAELDLQHERTLRLGAQLRLDRSEDPDEQLRVYSDPSGHTFCIFLAPR